MDGEDRLLARHSGIDQHYWGFAGGKRTLGLVSFGGYFWLMLARRSAVRAIRRTIKCQIGAWNGSRTHQ